MHTERNSNIELLRVVAMMAIIAGHLINQGGIIDNLSTQVVSIYLGSGSRVAVNIFLFIGVYFMVDSKFKATRVLNLWGELFIYTFCFTILAFFIDRSVSVKDVIKGIFPFSTRALWFASAYLILIVLHPFLQRIFLISKKQLYFLVAALTYFLCVMPTFAAKQNDFIVNIAWFVYVYILVGMVKKYTDCFSSRRNALQKYGLFIGLLIYLILTSFRTLSLVCDNTYVDVLCRLSEQYLSDIKSLPNALCALCIFISVVSREPAESKIINNIARPAFAAYIIHQTPAFYPILWAKIIYTDYWFSFEPVSFILLLLVSVLFIYSVCYFVDLLRTNVFEYFFWNSQIYLTLSTRYDAVMNNSKNC